MSHALTCLSVGHQFLLSVWRIGPKIMLLQDSLFAAANPASTQELKPIAILSFSTVFLLVSFQFLPLQLPQLFKSPFLGNLTMQPLAPIFWYSLFLPD